MNQKITRREFASATTLALPLLNVVPCRAHTLPDSGPSAGTPIALALRPYQLLCLFCQLGRSGGDDAPDPKLDAIAKALRHDPRRPVTLRCNVDTVYRYQNPGPADDSPEGALFNAKRDLDILQRLGLVPGDTRPAIDILERVLAAIPETRGICGYETATPDAWLGCPRARNGDYERGRQLGIHAIIPARDPDEMAAAKRESTAAITRSTNLGIRPHHLLCMSCFYGARERLAPIPQDNLFEAIDAIQKRPGLPVTLIQGVCMICPPCPKFDPANRLCIGGRSMALRDQKKDLDVLQRLGLRYGDTLPARSLFDLLYERIPAVRDICGYGDGQARSPEWSICGAAEKGDAYRKARERRLGFPT